MDPNPRLTVIVPSYNQSVYLRATLESVRAQPLRGWECIVVDDGSTDDSVAIATEIAAAEPRFRVIKQENAGVASARNRGIEAARGEFVSFLDSDDLVTPALGSKLLPVIEHDRTLDVVYGRHRLIDPGGLPTGFVSAFQPGIDDYVVTLIIRNLFALNAAIVRREFLLTQGLRFRPNRRPEDWAFWIELAIAGAGFRAVDTLISEYRVHPAARTREVVVRAQRAENMLAEMVSMASANSALPGATLTLARLCMYCRRFSDAVGFADHEAAEYCLEKLRDILRSPRVLGFSKHHLFAFGQLLNVVDQGHVFRLLQPFAWLRRAKRKIMG